MNDRILNWFNVWFTSRGGVWQTFYFTIIIVLIELFSPSFDPHMFWLLVWLTIYSAVTQPMLAHSSYKASMDLGRIIEHSLVQEKAMKELLLKNNHLALQNQSMERQILNVERSIHQKIDTLKCIL